MSLRLVKGLVIAMSVALAVGFVVLMVGLAQKAMRLGDVEEGSPIHAALDLPDGSAIVTIAGAGNRLAVLVEHPDGQRKIHLIDPASGRVTGIVAAD